MPGLWNTFESSAARILEKAWGFCYVLSHYPTAKVSTSHPFLEDSHNFGRLQSPLCCRVSLISIPSNGSSWNTSHQGLKWFELLRWSQSHHSADAFLRKVCLFEARPDEADGIRLSVSGRGDAAAQRGGSWRFPAKTTGRSLSQRKAKLMNWWLVTVYDDWWQCKRRSIIYRYKWYSVLTYVHMLGFAKPAVRSAGYPLLCVKIQ